MSSSSGLGKGSLFYEFFSGMLTSATGVRGVDLQSLEVSELLVGHVGELVPSHTVRGASEILSRVMGLDPDNILIEAIRPFLIVSAAHFHRLLCGAPS